LTEIQNIAYFCVDMQNLVKIGRCAVELLRIFDFQNGSRPPSWIWYDVIEEHQRFLFDGPNILLKLQVDVFILCKIYRFIYSARLAWNCLFTPFWGSFWGCYSL